MKTRGQAIPILVIVGVILLLMANPIYFVQSGQKAVIKRFGVVNPEIINEGMHFKTPFIDSVITVDVTPQNVAEETLAYTKDNQPITVHYNIIYTKPVGDIANTVIKYNKLPYENFAKAKLTDTFKSIAGKYTASEFVTKREAIRREFLTQSKSSVINTDYNKPVIDIIDTPITNVDFDDAYEKAISEKQVAQQTAQKAQYVLQKAEIDAQSKVATAEGEAKALQIKAQAIAKNQGVVELNRIEKWNGVIPLGAKTVIVGDTAVLKALQGDN